MMGESTQPERQQVTFHSDLPKRHQHQHRHRQHAHHHRQQIYLTSTPDGGWGWVVIFATFMVFFFTVGFKTSMGVFYLHWSRYFQAPKYEVAWVTSLSPLMIAIVSPLAAAICHAIGPRVPVMFGGVVAATGLLASTYSQSIYHLIITIGIVSATGMGFAFAPSIIVLHHYFEKRFVVANGIAFAGISCGELIYPLVLRPMIKAYGWRGALFIMSAVELNLVICGGVMIRPRQSWRKHRVRRKPSSRKIPSLDVATIHDDTKNGRNKDEADSGVFNNELEENNNVSSNRMDWRRGSAISRESRSTSLCSWSSVSSSSSFYEPRPRFLSEPRRKIALFMFGPTDEARDDDADWDLEVLSGNFAMKNNFSAPSFTGTDSARRKDTVIDGREKRPRGHSVLSHHSIIEPSYSVIEEFKHEKFMMGRPLHNKFFLVMLPIMLMHGIGWYAVLTHIVPFAVSFGIPDDRAFNLVAFIGFGSLIGCLTHGWFIDKNMISSEFAKIGSLTVLTVITLSYPAAHYSYPALCTLSVFYGIAAGVSLPLFFALIRQLLPPEDVNAGVSLIIIMEMMGDCIGGVCAGLMYDLTHDYEISFFFAGGAIAVAVFLQIGLSLFKRRSYVRETHTYKISEGIELSGVDAERNESGFKKKVITSGTLVPKRLDME